LTDPGSAYFRDVAVTPIPIRAYGSDSDAYELLVCGRVNSKNAAGDFVGLRPWMAVMSVPPKQQNVSTSWVAGDRWHPCEGCRDFADFYAEDAQRLTSLCTNPTAVIRDALSGNSS
jgi:hypothetical protein